MADYEKQVRDILCQNGCSFIRRGKGDHDIWYSPITGRHDVFRLVKSLSRKHFKEVARRVVRF